jgi:hypothetical protein
VKVIAGLNEQPVIQIFDRLKNKAAPKPLRLLHSARAPSALFG